MDVANFLIQLLNSVQYGLLLFMLTSGLTLIFGIMGRGQSGVRQLLHAGRLLGVVTQRGVWQPEPGHQSIASCAKVVSFTAIIALLKALNTAGRDMVI